MHAMRALVLGLSLLAAGSVVAGPIYLRQLPHADAFRKAADHIGSRLRDEIISTGSFDIGAMHAVGAGTKVSDRELAQMNLDLCARIAKIHDDKLPKDLAAGTSVKPFSGTAVERAGKHLASVNAYTPGNGEEARLAKTVWVLVHKAGLTEQNGRVVTSRARFWDSSTGTRKYLTQTTFFNADSGRALVLYMISGTM